MELGTRGLSVDRALRAQLVGAGEHKEGEKRRPHRKPDLFQVWNMESGVCKQFVISLHLIVLYFSLFYLIVF